MQKLTEKQVEEKYATLSAHQRARIMIVHKVLYSAALGILSNTPNTPSVEEGVKELRKIHDTVISAIANERNM